MAEYLTNILATPKKLTVSEAVSASYNDRNAVDGLPNSVKSIILYHMKENTKNLNESVEVLGMIH